MRFVWSGLTIFLASSLLHQNGSSVAGYMAVIKALETCFAAGSPGVMQTSEVLLRNLAWARI